MIKCPHCSTELLLSIAPFRSDAAPEPWLSPAPSALIAGSGYKDRQKELAPPTVRPQPVPVDAGRVGHLLSSIDTDNCDAKSQKFIQETRERFEKYGENILLSPAQMAWIERLAG